MGGTPKRKPKTPRRIESDDEPSDGNASYARQPEPEQRMSKEKQKFFRFSAFNLVKRKCRESSSEWEGWERSRWGGVRVTRVQRLELRLERRSSSSSSSSGSPPSPPPPLPAPTLFERLADTGSDVWGFAAEAQKQRRVAPCPAPRPAPCTADAAAPAPSRPVRRRSRCGDRLLTTLFDGLSEFYSVRAGSRVASTARHKPREGGAEQRQERQERQVLKETRSTFRRYQAALSQTRSASWLVRRLAENKRGAITDDKLLAAPATNQTGKRGP